MENTYNKKRGNQIEDFISIKDLFYLCLGKWYWFVISLAITLSVAIYYLLTTPPTYTRQAELLIKVDSKGNPLSGGMEQTFADMGVFKANTNVNNEVISLKSSALMYEVVKRLQLNVAYYTEGRFHRDVVYGTSQPLKVSLPDLLGNESCEFTLEMKEGEVHCSEFFKNEKEVEIKDFIKGKLNDTISSPVGRLIITPTPHYNKGERIKLYVNHSPLHIITNNYSSQLNIGLSDEKASVIALSIKDVCPQRAEDILNTLISIYNENWVKDKNQIAVSTSMFISERLSVIERELGNVDENISTFKRENLLPDVQTASNLYMTQNTQTNAQILTLNNQLYMTRYIRRYLTSKSNKKQLLPTNSGIENANIEAQISKYNTQLLQRNGLVANSSERNPLVIDMDMALESMRKAIIASVDNQIETLKAQSESLRQSKKQTTTKLAENPSQAKYLLSVERQQKVKEALYLFLLQKREENELSQAFTAYNTRVITPPRGSTFPTAPVQRNILLVAFVLGILIPFLILFVKENMNTKVRGRKDLNNLSIPFIGEIPFYYRSKKRLFENINTDANPIVVKEDTRDVINEAFRVLRTNLEFMTEKGGKSNVIILTSFNPGSGKSFLTMNIAISLAIKKKKVLLIDGDMRNASSSACINSPQIGLSNYLGGGVDDLSEIIVPDNKYKTMSVVPVGTIPPNPTELLFENRLQELIDFAREQYDYVLIDCPPVELVADTQIVEKLADRTIFVLRSGLLERSMLSVLQNMYDEKKYKNISMILNGTKGGYGYGYGYGYGSGYHYGYSKAKYRNKILWLLEYFNIVKR